MKIVIDIPEETYNFLQRYGTDGGIIEKAVLNGTPLSKGHGRLIDADALKKDDEVTEWISLNPIRTGKMLKSFSELFIKKIDATPTIIEADNGDKK